MNKIKKNATKGFSLVELIVVVAIMAVLTAVLAPSLLAYVERTRAQKDDSAMGEVTNAIMLALADQDVYDEVLFYTCKDNKSCYVDSESAGDAKIVTKDADKNGEYSDGDQWMLGADARLLDEEEFAFAGVMRGVTITFEPVISTNKSKFILADGKINGNDLVGKGFTVAQYINTKPVVSEGVTSYEGTTPTKFKLGEMTTGNGHSYLYNRVRATVGDEIALTSQTYRNSDYTVFIRMGTTGGFQADAQDAIMVYGQWNGTNLDIK
jgi:prepilin-type N-terminal cleavage/methylation domain-containing protein